MLSTIFAMHTRDDGHRRFCACEGKSGRRHRSLSPVKKCTSTPVFSADSDSESERPLELDGSFKLKAGDSVALEPSMGAETSKTVPIFRRQRSGSVDMSDLSEAPASVLLPPIGAPEMVKSKSCGDIKKLKREFPATRSTAFAELSTAAAVGISSIRVGGAKLGFGGTLPVPGLAPEDSSTPPMADGSPKPVYKEQDKDKRTTDGVPVDDKRPVPKMASQKSVGFGWFWHGERSAHAFHTRNPRPATTSTWPKDWTSSSD